MISCLCHKKISYQHGSCSQWLWCYGHYLMLINVLQWTACYMTLNKCCVHHWVECDKNKLVLSCAPVHALFKTQHGGAFWLRVRFSKTCFKHRSVQINGNYFMKLNLDKIYQVKVHYFLPYIFNNPSLLFCLKWSNSITIPNWTHVYMNFYHHIDLGNHLLKLRA
jgi:hypothetical protein